MFVELLVFFFKQKTAYEMRISDWSSDVCSSDLIRSGEYHMGKAFDLTSDGLIGGLSNARCSIVRPTCHADQNVLFRPAALRIHFPKLLEIDLELASAIGECGSIVGNVRIRLLTQPDQVGARAVEPILHRVELQTRQ